MSELYTKKAHPQAKNHNMHSTWVLISFVEMDAIKFENLVLLM